MLVRYIKNSLLTKTINELDVRQHPDIIELIRSINRADFDHPFFQAENHTTEPCNQYELYLTYAYLSHLYLNDQLAYPGSEVDLSGFLSTVKTRKRDGHNLPFLDKDDFLQSYFIHAALQSHPEKITLYNAQDSENEALIQDYIKQLHADFPMVAIDRLEQIIGSLSGINRIFVRVSTTRHEDPLLYNMIRPGGFIDVHTATPFNETHIVPSISFIHALAQECNPSHQVTMEPIFGQISVETLHRDFHQYLCHPINIYSTWIQNNLASVHHTQSSKLSVAMHDSYYHFMALCQFEPSALDFLAKELCPALKNLAANKNLEINSSAILSYLFEKMNDFAVPPNSSEKINVWSYIRNRITYPFGNSKQERYRHNRNIDLLIMAIHSLNPSQAFIETNYQINLSNLLEQITARLTIKPPPGSVIHLADLLNLVAEHSLNYGVHESISAINFLLEQEITVNTELILLLIQHCHRQLTTILKNIVRQHGDAFFQQAIAEIKEEIESYPSIEEPSIPEYIRTSYLVEQALPLVGRDVKKQLPKERIESILDEIVPIFLSTVDLSCTPAKPVRTSLEPFQPFLNSPTFFMFLAHFKKINFHFSEQNWQNIINYGEMVGCDFTSIVRSISLINDKNIHLLTNELMDLILAPPTYTPYTTSPLSLSETQNQHAQNILEIFAFLTKRITERMPTKINFFHEEPLPHLAFQQLLYAMNRETISQSTMTELQDDSEFRRLSEKKEYSPIIELFCSMQSVQCKIAIP
ncbi:hypothetical protein ACD661_00900 [Legionella lytica]|uniref:Uncharacterized protein n=1 Tax=Legionella lytica TaxID=96232 RepID=A0ABW8D340_9GAMM